MSDEFRFTVLRPVVHSPKLWPKRQRESSPVKTPVKKARQKLCFFEPTYQPDEPASSAGSDISESSGDSSATKISTDSLLCEEDLVSFDKDQSQETLERVASQQAVCVDRVYQMTV